MNASRPKICIVDDDAAVQESLCTLLDAFGFESHGFANAEEFWRADLSAEMDGMVVDVRLQSNSGIELVKQLAAAGYEVPTILISGHRDDEVLAQLARFKAVGFLKKPFQPDTLVDWLNRHCAK